jgi:nitroreductase
METLDCIASRKSTRSFKPVQIEDWQLEKILQAANRAPVAHGEYHALHLTVVQDAEVLTMLKDSAMDCFRDPIRDIYYGAPTVVIISTSHGSVPELDIANAGTICQTMMLCAADIGVDSCYVLGTVLAMRADPDIAEDINLPEGYEAIGSVAFGHAAEAAFDAGQGAAHVIKVNRI